MADADLRQLEREAATGDPEAEARLRRERCRVEGHLPESYGISFRYDEEKFIRNDEIDASDHRKWLECQRCGERWSEPRQPEDVA